MQAWRDVTPPALSAMGLATRHVFDTIVTIGTFTSIPAMAPKVARAFIADRFDNLGAVAGSGARWHLVHGTADIVVPPAHAAAIEAEAIRHRRKGAGIVVPGGAHPIDGALLARLLIAIDADAVSTLTGVGVRPFARQSP